MGVKLGCGPETLRGWVRFVELQQIPSEQDRLTERERVKKLERESLELRLAGENLRNAAALFAQAKLDRPRR